MPRSLGTGSAHLEIIIILAINGAALPFDLLVGS